MNLSRQIPRVPGAGRFSRSRVATLALMFALGVTSAYADGVSITLKFSGTSANSATNLQEQNSSNDEDNFIGKSAFGEFTVRNLRAISNSPGTSDTCSGANRIFFPELAGGGVFRFQGGGLLYIHLTQGGDCIDLSTNTAHCTLVFEITGGTGQFKNASGVLTMTETVMTVLADAQGNPVLFAATGQYTGTINGVASADAAQSVEQ